MDMITIQDFCVYHNVEHTFIDHLQDAGVVTVTVVNENVYIPMDQITRLERLARLHTQLGINEAGVIAVEDLLKKFEDLQQEMLLLRSRLRLYEET